MIHPLLTESRILFIVSRCQRCAVWLEFVERINSELEFNKRIEVIDCVRYHDYGIVDDPKIPLFMPYIQGEYPVLFFEGGRKDGTNTRIEAEAWLRAKVHEDFIFKQHNPYFFDKQCR